MSKIRIGFVGVGGMGQAAHLRNYVITPDCEVVAIAEIRPKLGKRVADRYGIPKVYDGFEAMLANEQLDGIVAIQPFGMHVNTVPALLTKGVPVITEKPIADSLEHGRAILAAVEKAKGKLFLAYHKRSDPATLRVIKQVQAWKQSGEVGKLKYVRVAMPPGDWSVQGMSHNVWSDEGYDAGGGKPYKEWGAYEKFVNYYIHQVNLIRFLLGEDYQVLYADPAGVTIGLRSASGVSATLEMATHSTTIDWQEEAFVAFERGWIKLELPAPLAVDRPGRVTIFADKGKEHEPTATTPTLPWIHAMRSQAQQFVAACQGKPNVLCGAADAVKDLEVASQYIALLEQSTKAVATAAKAKG